MKEFCIGCTCLFYSLLEVGAEDALSKNSTIVLASFPFLYFGWDAIVGAPVGNHVLLEDSFFGFLQDI